MMGAELSGPTANFSDNFTANDYRLQMSFKYKYAKKLGELIMQPQHSRDASRARHARSFAIDANRRA